MKLVNYKRGYNDLFNCSIHGTIYMNNMEWGEVYRYIQNNKTLLDKYDPVFYWKLFADDCERTQANSHGYCINIRVRATEAIARKYKLNNYKLGNYQLCIVNDPFMYNGN